MSKITHIKKLIKDQNVFRSEVMVRQEVNDVIQRGISYIKYEKRGPHHSKCDCVNHLYYLCEIESFQSLILKYKHMYTQYFASQIFHCR